MTVLHEDMDELSAAWAAKFETEAEQLSSYSEEEQWRFPSIYRVPHFIRETIDTKGRNFEPQVVSFGPFHHGGCKLKPMERHKERAVAHLVRWTKTPLMNLLRAVKAEEKRLMESYEGLDGRWREGGDEFARMMTVDGCFMLELMRVYGTEYEGDYGPGDPVFRIGDFPLLMPYMRRDILMIENQIPLLLLATLLRVLPDGPHKNHDLNEYINMTVLNLCGYYGGILFDPSNLGFHALDLFRRTKLLVWPRLYQEVKILQQYTDEMTIRSATRLHECGIRFRSSPSSGFKDIRFDECSGELFLPPLMVDDRTECEFVNMVAFEHLHTGIGNGVSAFVQLMAKIIDNDRDVDVLKRQGVLGNALGGDRNLVELFNNLAKEITIGYNTRLRNVEEKVSRYSGRRRNKWSTHLRQYYFRSPWTVLSIVAAAFAILLSLLQTIYTVWGFYHKN